MCEDLDFLDRVGDLVEWLGFRLLRNPFIVDKALDDIVSSRLEISVRDDRWLKYWSSASWHQNLKLSSKKYTVLKSSKPLESQSTPTIKARWKKQPPPQPLVKPLVSISPEDDVVDGSRIAAAQQILLDEESFHGRLLALKAVQEYVDRGPSILKRCEVGNNVEPPAVYDAIAALNAQQKHNKKTEEETSRRDGIRKKTEEGSVKLRPKKKKPQKCHQSVGEGPGETNNTTNDIAADIESDILVIVEKKSSIPVTNGESPETIYHQLEEKRQRMVYLKRSRLEQQARTAKENEHVLDSRRAENVAMKREDTLSRIVELEAKRKAQLRAQKEIMNQVASCAMFKCMHEMNGKRFLISVYTRNARGYDLEGLRIVAYDPSTSATFTLVMTFREFNSLGYGRTSEGLRSFCKWLCLLYDKRRRQFRIVWSGAPCPPPLRVRENDQALVCLHKEGVKMRSSSTGSYSFVAVYLRTDDRSTVRFVVGSWHNHEFLLTEHAVAARCLVAASNLDVWWGSTDHAMIVWRHHADTFNNEEEKDKVSTTDIGQRIYSSEVIMNRVKYAVHMYNTSETEYTVELILKPRKADPIQEVIHPSVNRLVLNKRSINPYNVHFSSSNYADLISLIRFEQIPLLEPIEEGGETCTNEHATLFKWKTTISPKWAGKLANYVRVLRLAKYASKISGVFCFIAVFIVQQKTEFRAHLLLEITWLHPTLSSSFSLGGVPTRQSLRIALSDYLRCANDTRRFAAGLADSEGEECSSCVAYTDARTKLLEQDLCPVPETSLDYSSSCSNCTMIQYRRLHAIKELIAHAGAIAPEALELIYHGYCERCAMLVPPIVLVLGSALSSSMIVWLLPLLEHYFTSFDSNKNGFLHFERSDGHTIAEEGLHARGALLLALARDQVAVLFNASCGVTVGSANVFVHELHWWLYPDHHDLPCHVAYVVGDANDVNSEARDHRDYDLLEALQALNYAACQIAELDPVRLDDGDNEESDHASAFDAYLVAEAVLVEATRVILHPDYSWQKPREIIGASSWSSACSFLLEPAQLSAHLQQCNPLQLDAATVEVLDAYFTHAKWPHDYPDVRPFFYGLLAFMMHLQHVRHILALRNGSLQSSLQRVARDEIATEHEQLAKNTSQLGRSEGMVDETQATVDTSKRVLRGMTWSGWVYNKLSAAPQLSNSKEPHEIAMGFICPDCKVKFQSADQLGMHYGNVHERLSNKEEQPPNLLEKRPNNGQIKQQSRVAESIGDIHDKFLRDLEPQLAELKEQSLALGSALDTQNEQLGRLDTKIGRVHHDMKQVGIQVTKMAGRKVPVVFRFRCAFQEVQTGKFLRDVDGEAQLGEKSSNFLGINRYGNLKVQGADFNSYEQFLVESKASTPIFCLSSYFGLGGWVAMKEPVNSNKLTIIGGTLENRSAAAHFRIVNLEDGINEMPTDK
ncbi:Zinc finger, C2H2 [Phytophthora cactorum]|nr:Zinc finger, C2H2 [Phytophthora cactorum]